MPRTSRSLHGLTLASALLAAVLIPTAPASSTPVAPRPAAATVGRWHTTPIPTGTRLSWHSPDSLPVGGAAPEVRLGSRLLGHPVVTAGLHDLVLTVRGPAPDVDDLSVWLSGRRLDRAQPDARRTAPAVGSERQARPLSVDPGVHGPYATVASDYRVGSARVPDLPLAVPTAGHVVAPVDAAGARPLVLFLHGRHPSCYEPGSDQLVLEWPCPDGFRPVPSHLGYRYLQRLLASQGYVTVSVDAAAIDGQETFSAPDFGAAARAALVQRHLRRWAAWAADPSSAWYQRVDLSSVTLVGHSRGGEGVVRAALTTPASAPYAVDGLVLLAPSDFGRQAAPGTPTVTLLGYCDGDVTDLAGVQYEDVGRDLVGDTAVRSTALVMGANHNFFNTEWTPGRATAFAEDDWREPKDPVCGTDAPGRLTAGQQRAVAKAYVAGAVRLVAQRDDRVLPMFDGSEVSVASAGDADVRSTAVGGRRTLIAAGQAAAVTASGSARARLCGGRSGGPAGVCGAGIEPSRTPHWPLGDQLPYRPGQPALELRWTRAGGGGLLRLAQPVDLSGYRHLDLRVVVGTRHPQVRLGVELVDVHGRSVRLTPRHRGRLEALPGHGVLGKLLAQTLRTPLPRLTGVDLGRLIGIRLVALSGAGRVWVLDAAGRNPGLAPVTHPPLPQVSVADVTEPEGSAGDPQQLDVTLHVTGTLTTPTRVAVRAFEPVEGRLIRRTSVLLEPGDTEVVVPVPVERDDLDDWPGRSSFDVAVFATDGSVVTTDYAGRMTLVDDDPTPSVTITPVADTVDEGAALRWKVRLSAPVDYVGSFGWHVERVPGDVPQLHSDDVPASWLESMGVEPPTSPVALWRLDLFGAVALEPGQQSAVVRIPTVDDGRAEGREVVGLRFTGEPPELGEVTTQAGVRDRP